MGALFSKKKKSTAAAAAKATAKAGGLAVGARVVTFAGPGVVAEVREGGEQITVTLDWKLAQGQGATAHLNKASVRAADAIAVGARVATFAGPGVVASIREDGELITVTLDWKLAQGQGATAHLNKASVSLEKSTDAPAAAAVEEPAAPAVEAVEAVAPAPVEAAAPAAVPAAKADAIALGTRVTTFAGPGVVADIREDGELITVTLDWQLAQGQGATAHLNKASARVA